MKDKGERPPRLGLRLILRAFLAGALVIAMTATAVATTGILEVDRVKDILTRNGRQVIKIPEVTSADAGKPRTILMLGSDARYGDKKAGLPPRSDTILLARVDPDRKSIAVMSIPRDLAVTIPGRGTNVKINEAFSDGGPRLTVKTIQNLFHGVTGDPFPINNVLIVNFGSFRRAVRYIGGVYVDVDRHYFNDNSAGQNYATIDVPAGYQKLSGKDALDYVRYRHGDSDLIRAARQQDFLSQARNMPGFKKLLQVGDRDRLARAFQRYFQFSDNFTSTKEIFRLLKLALFVAQKHPPVHELRFPVYEAEDPALDTRLYYHDDDVRQLVRDFMGTKSGADQAKPQATATPSPADKQTQRERRKRNRHRDKGPVPGLVDATPEGRNQAVLADPKLKFPFYFPGLRNSTGAYADTQPRIYRIKDEQGHRHQAYRLVVSKGLAGQYWGVQGMTWRYPPILDNPDATRTEHGRHFEIHKNGSHYHLVSWRTKRAVYWVSNTLTDDLSNAQMLAIAASLTRLKQ